MQLNRTGTPFTREERNKQNENWQTIEDNFNNVVSVISDEAVQQVIGSAKLTWQTPVNTYEDIASTYPNPLEGWAVMARQDSEDYPTGQNDQRRAGTVWRYDSMEWKAVQQIDPTMINEVEDRLNTKINQDMDSLEVFLTESSGVNVDRFGAIGDGISDDTQAFFSANASFNVLVLSKGKTYRVQNFIPKAGTVIIANGATISRYDSSVYETTGSSASVIVTNDDISIYGGTWTELGNTDMWSGSILIENGSLRIDNAIIENSWGGIFGNKLQNNGKIARYVSVTNCEIRNCIHNTYLSDIENLLFSNNHSHHSSRDGLRTHRNVKNIVITNNHIYENGNGSLDQSQDAIDLFIAGYKCVIKNNFLYNNDYKGIDIKRSPDGVGEIVVDEEFIIEGNYIYGNKFSGIEITSDSTLGFIKNISIINNRIYENQSYGIRSNFGDMIQYSHNQIYNNAREGIRIENCINGGIVSDNIIFNNCTSMSTNNGIYVLVTALNVDVYHNRLFSDNTTQTIGINYNSNGLCSNNSVIGHENKLSSGGFQDNKGERYAFVIKSDGSNNPIAIPRPSLLTSIILSFEYNDTFNVSITKRNESDGSYSSELYNSTLTVPNAFTKIKLDISNLNLTSRRIQENQIILVSISDTNESRISNVYVGFEVLS